VQSHGGVTATTTPETGFRHEAHHVVQPIVRGTVRHADGRPAPGRTVIARQLGLGEPVEVGRDRTHTDGSYEISAPSLADAAAADGSAVLAVCALDDRSKEVARAGPVTSDDGAWSIDLVVPDKKRRGAEFQRLLADATREAERSGRALDDIEDTTDRPDVLVLSQTLGVPGASVRALLAARSSARVLVDSSTDPAPTGTDGRRGRSLSEHAAAALLFALWRTSSNVDLDDLLDRPNSELERQLRVAVDERIVPASARPQIPAFLARLDRERSHRLAAAPPAALASVVRDATVRGAISDVAVAHGLGTDAFWDALRKEKSIPAATADQLETATAFLDVSGGHVQLLDRLVDRDALTPSELAGMTVGDWKRLLRLKTVGPVTNNAPGGNGVDAYAASLYTAVGNRYPTERFVDRLNRDSRDRHPLVAARADIETFVTNNPDFDLRETPIEALLSEKGTSRAKRIKGLSDPDGAISLLKGVQRITRLLLDPALVAGRPTDDGAPQPAPAAIDPYQAASRFIADGIDSAPAIVARPRAEFVEHYSDLLGGAEVAEILYRRASAVTDASLVKALEIHEIAYPSIESAQPTVTTWRDQFGSVDLCECEHCSSMTSPAAYLFDCLKLLQDAPRPNGKTPLDVLVQRRPDLVRLALNCDNTETRLPFIDLVNEILERRVAPTWFQPFELENVTAADLSAGFASDVLRAAFASDSWELSQEAHVDIAVRNSSGNPSAWHVLDAGRLFGVHQAGSTFTVTSLTFQTVGTEEELRAAPAHVVPAAYRILAGQVFPWHLPFALPYTEIQAYLSAIETSIAAVIEAFENGGLVDALRRDDVAASYLGLSPDELAIIVGVKLAGGGAMTLGGPTDRPADFWGGRDGLIETIATPPGVSPIIGTWDSVLTYVPVFLERSELTYVELLRLLDCYFVNPVATDGSPRKITIVSLDPAEPATCELDKLSLKGLDLEALRKIHRFVRLRRALKWDYADLDRALGALGETDLGPDTVVALTLIDRLAKETGWPVRELCALWGDLDHARYIDRSDERQALAPTLYEELFRKNPQVASPDPAFVADPAALAGKLADHAAALMAALTISQTDLDSLLADTRVVPPDADLTLEHLTSVYRSAALAGMAGITPAELLALLDMGATNPVVAPGASNALDRVHAVWSFLWEAKQLLGAKIDVETLHYLLVEDGSSPTELDLTTKEIAQLLEEIRSELGTLVAATTYVPDADGRTIAQELVKLGWRQQDAAAAQRFFANTEVYAEPLDAAFVPTGIPADSRVAYHQLAGELRCVGTLTSAEIAALTAIPAASQEFKDAIAELASSPRTFAQTALQRVAPPTYSVALSALPSDLVIPPEIEHNLSFDQVAHRLRFRGDRTFLDLLTVPTGASGSEWTAFKAAVKDLKADPAPATVDEEPAATENRFFASAQARDQFSDGVADPLARCAFALEAIRRAMWKAKAPDLAAQALAAALGLDEPSMSAARASWAPLAFDTTGVGPSELVASATPITPDAYPEQFAIVRRLYKLGVLLAKLDVPVAIRPWLVRRADVLLGLDVVGLPGAPGDVPAPLAGYKSVAAVVRLLETTKADSAALSELFELVGSTTFTRAEWTDAMARLYREDVETIGGLTATQNVSLTSASSPQFYLDFAKRLSLRRRIGVEGGTLSIWAAAFGAHDANGWRGDFTDDRAREVKLAVQGAFARDRWLKASTEIQDELRERKRDALVAYLLRRPGSNGELFRDDADLFAHLLIDIQMGSCMTTSRMKQAIASVQTFIQRVILNLEPDAFLDPEVAAAWQEWRRRYRLWEAHRRIIINPEDWIEPSLRDDKSESYRAFESRLLQVEPTDSSAWRALGQFVERRAELARLEVCAVYEQSIYEPGEQAVTRVLHVFARTRATPRRYYHRRRVIRAPVDSPGTWTAWQKLELDIEGEHLLPIATGRRLYLIWPLIREAPEPILPAKPQSTWEIGLAWSVFDGKEWSPKSQTPAGVALRYPEHADAPPEPSLHDPAKRFTFQVLADVDGIHVRAYAVERSSETVPYRFVTPIPPSPPVGPSLLGPDALKAYPQLEVTVTKDGVPVTGATATLTSRSVGLGLPSRYMVVGATPFSPPVYWVVVGNTRKLRTTDDTGLAVFGQFTNTEPEIVLERPMTLTVSIPDEDFEAKSQTTPPITLYNWLLPGADFGRWRIAVDFHKAIVTTGSTSTPIVTRIGGFWSLVLHENNRAELGYRVFLGDLLPPPRTLPHGQWWEEDRNDPTIRKAPLELPGQAVEVFRKTPAPYRLLPEPLLGPIRDCENFAFEVLDKTYLVERQVGGGTVPTFTVFFDPVAEQIWEGVIGNPDAALSRKTQMLTDGGETFRRMFDLPAGTSGVPAEMVEFGRHDVFASENWETFLHVELGLSSVLTRHNRFAEAQRWLHSIYNPLTASASPAKPWEAWQFLPFYTAAQLPPRSIADLLITNASEREAQLEWRRNPFNPYAVGRLRISAFMKTVVMRYLDNLIAWGDQLFRQDTIESINEATQLYLLAQAILGPPPPIVPPRAKPVLQTFESLSESGLTTTPSSGLGLLAVEISSFIEPNAPASSGTGSLGSMLYFCVPKSERLSDYWKKVEGRLEKIRHCQNIEGRKRELSLFDAQIDPGLLVRAKAAGVDIGSILDDLYAPPPHYRFSALAQKATELCNEVRSLGAALLSALEKQDAETLARLRQSHETIALSNVGDVRRQQVAEAQAQVEALTRSRELAALRFRYYQRLLGDGDESAPTRGDSVRLTDYLPASVPVGAGASDTQGLMLAQHETEQLDHLDEANNFMFASNAARAIAGILHAIPNSVAPVSFGGLHIGAAADATAGVLQLLSTNSSHQASRLSIVGSFVRRQDDWTLQRNASTQELSQLDAQLDGADLRVEIARAELRNQSTLVEQSKAVGNFLQEKHTTEELYEWMVGQLSGLYYQSYELAYNVAKQAEVAFRRDLGLRSSDWINFGYWDSLKRGLLAGETLALDLKRMEAAYLEQNARDYEITKHVSLLSLDPNAFLDLKSTGSCRFELPEWLFDLDYPGHYLRRIRSASVTVPCVIGPYANVNCTVTLESSSVRIEADSTGDYDRNPRKPDDPRFLDIRGASESIVTSSAQDDSGLFEATLRDERYLPFESHGAVSRWSVRMKSSDNGLALESATDFILHVRYTARDGGPDLEDAARKSVGKRIGPASRAPLYRMLSLRHEYPTEWSKYRSAGGLIGPLDLSNRFPALFAHRKITVRKDRLYFAVTGDVITPLKQGTQKVKLRSTSAITVAAPTTDTIDPGGATPDDLLVVIPYVVADR
jgi:hypothetical protein